MRKKSLFVLPTLLLFLAGCAAQKMSGIGPSQIERSSPSTKEDRGGAAQAEASRAESGGGTEAIASTKPGQPKGGQIVAAQQSPAAQEDREKPGAVQPANPAPQSGVTAPQSKGLPPPVASSELKTAAATEKVAQLKPQTKEPDQSFREPKVKTQYVAFNFDNADLFEVTQVVSEITGLNYLIAPGVAGKVTIETAGRISIDAVFDLFMSILEINNLTAVRSGEVYKIMPIARARQSGVQTIYGGLEERKPSDRLVTRVVPLKYISAAKMLEILKPFISPYGNVMMYPTTNMLILVDIESNQKSLLDLAKIFDVDSFEQLGIKLKPVKHVKADDLVKEVQGIYNALGVGKVTAGGGIELVPIARINAVMILSSTAELLASAESLLEKIDLEPVAKGVQSYVYYVEHRTSRELASLLMQIYAPEKGEAAPAKPSAPTPSTPPGVRPAEPPKSPLQAAVQQPPPKQPEPPKPATEAPVSSGAAAVTEGPVKIIADEFTNSLIIQAVPADYKLIEITIKQLDLKPKQVLIEMLFLEVTLSDELQHGIQSVVGLGDRTGRSTSGGFIASRFLGLPLGTTDATSFVTATERLAGLSFAFAQDTNLNIFLNALASKSKLRVLSNPHLLVSNNKQATINVGDEVPVVTGETTTRVAGTQLPLVSGAVTPVVDRNIQFRSTGVSMTVTPHINTNNLVTLELQEEVSAAERTVTSGIDTPTINTRRSQTTVVVKDGQTIVIAGLMSESARASETKVPLLGDIPWFGNLFKTKTDSNEKTELIILITPRVVETKEEADSMTEDFKKRVGSLAERLKKRESPGK